MTLGPFFDRHEHWGLNETKERREDVSGTRGL